MNYLYNGVELPALPEWDKTVYPYAYIGTTLDNEKYELLLVDKELTAGENNMIPINGLTRNAVYYDSIDGGWVLQGDFAVKTLSPVWCSVDLHYHNYSYMGELAGKLYLKASEPVPVPETTAPSVDPLSLLMGWRMGNAVRNTLNY